MEEKAGRFLVTAADDATVELADVDDGQVVTLSSNPGLDPGEVVEGTVSPDPPLGVSWSLVEVNARYRIDVEAVDDPPTDQARALADGLGVGEIAREPTGVGELHVLRVPTAETTSAVDDVLSDEATLRRAARLDSRTVEVKGADGIVTVRYRTEQ